MPGQKAAESTRREQILKAAYEVALRRGIDGLTVRAVAARARLSHGLVLFHFKRKDQLGLALLDRVLETTLSLSIPEAIGSIPDPSERLLTLFRHEMHRLMEEPRRIRLLLEYWARGAHNAVIRGKISARLDGYRSLFQTVTAVGAPAAGRSSMSAGMAAVAVSMIFGYPVQAIIDAERLDIDEYLAVVQAMIGRSQKAA
jgi:AcrR family transcriptional regulator